MKILICLLISVNCFAQLSDIRLKTHTVNGATITTVDSIKRIWKNHRDITPSHGMVHDYRLGDDTARYFHKVPGKTMRARVLFYDEAIGLPDVGPIPDVQIDTVDSEALTYVNWARRGITTTPGWYAGTISYSTTGSASYEFTGKRIEIWGERGNHGTANIYIDGTLIETASWQGEVKLPALIFAKDVDEGDYRIQVVPTGDKNVLIDFLVIYR